MLEPAGLDAIAADVPLAAPPRPWPFRLLVQGLRSAFLLGVRWDRVSSSPLRLAFLLLLQVAIVIGLSRLYFDAAVNFNWRAAATGWASMLLVVWACYTLRDRPTPHGPPQHARCTADLLAIYLAQSCWLALLTGLLFVGLVRADINPDKVPGWIKMSIWYLPMAWSALATLVMLMRGGEPDIGRRVQAVYALALAVAVSYFVPPASFWSEAAAAPAAQAAESEPLAFDQELIEMQAPLLAQKLAALAPQRPGVADMYTITFAPFEGEEVFRRETRMVSEVMAKRFDAAGRQLQLLNHADEMKSAVWATPLNLRRAIEGVAKTMNRDEDVLFIYMTSHGAADGEMATNFWPLDVAPVVPRDLRKWLDEARIRHRVLTISACYSGSWIAPLAGDDTLVMTAADADHTSYGCGKKSELTFYGRAMFDEQLRNNTLSFEQAHAAARKVIATREKEAGKDDGYSNPQIKVGARIGPYLERMRAQRPVQ